jgi:EmrB/QacA subfamily drug resistance transporter
VSTDLPARAAPVPVEAPPVRRRGVFLALMCSVQFVLLVGGTVVTVSLPAIRQDLQLGDAQLQWIVTAFALPFGCLLLLGGRAADVFGRRRLFLTGLLVFAVGSLLCAAAPDAGLLIAARALAGLGAAMASPAAMSLLTGVFEGPKERSVALGAWAAVGALGATLGNVIGGVLTSSGGWRWIFLVNVPVCAVAFGAAFAVVPAIRPLPGQRLDVTGGLLVTAGIGCLIAGLTALQTDAGTALPWVALGGSALLLVLFVVSQVRGADPLLPPALFRSRSSFAFLFVLVTAGTGLAAYFVSSLYLQEVLGWSALQTGIAFVPWAALIAVTAQVVSRNLHRVGPRLLVPVALLLVAAGSVVLARALGTSTTYGRGLLPAFLLLGVGTGAAGVSCTVTAMSGLPRRALGVAAGALNSTQAIGGALAVAVVVLLSSTRAAMVVAAGRSALEAQIAGQRFALLVAAGVAAAGALVAAAALPPRVPVPASADKEVALSRPASAPLS